MIMKLSSISNIIENISDRIENILSYTLLVIVSCLFGGFAGGLTWFIGGVVLAEISDINIPLLSILVFVMIPAIELFIMAETDNLDCGEVWVFDLIFWALWLASLAAIGCIENNLKLGLSGFEAFTLSLGMPVGLVMIIAFIAFIVSCLNKIATRHIDR